MLRPHDQVHLRDTPQQLLALLLRHAPGHDDAHARVRLLAGGYAPKVTVHLTGKGFERVRVTAVVSRRDGGEAA